METKTKDEIIGNNDILDDITNFGNDHFGGAIIQEAIEQAMQEYADQEVSKALSDKPKLAALQAEFENYKRDKENEIARLNFELNAVSSPPSVEMPKTDCIEQIIRDEYNKYIYNPCIDFIKMAATKIASSLRPSSDKNETK